MSDYVEPVPGERRACRCIECDSCGATFLGDAKLADFTCPTCAKVLCQACSDAGHGQDDDHEKRDPARVYSDLRRELAEARAERDEAVALLATLGSACDDYCYWSERDTGGGAEDQYATMKRVLDLAHKHVSSRPSPEATKEERDNG